MAGGKKKKGKKQDVQATEAPPTEVKDETLVELPGSAGLRETAKSLLGLGSKMGQGDGREKTCESINRVDFAAAESSAPMSPVTRVDTTRNSRASSISHVETSKGNSTNPQSLQRTTSARGNTIEQYDPSSEPKRDRANSHKSDTSYTKPESDDRARQHTEASWAKIQEKAQLGASKKATVLKAPPRERPGSAAGDASKRPEVRSRRSKDGVGRSANSSSGASPRLGSRVPTEYMSSDDELDGLDDNTGNVQGVSEQSLSTARYQGGDSYALDESGNDKSSGRDFEGVTSRTAEDDNPQHGPKHSVKDLSVNQNDCEGRLHAAEESGAQAREEKATLELELQETQAARDKLQTQLASLQTLPITQQESPKPPVSTFNADNDLPIKITGLEEALEKNNQHLENANTQLAQTEQNLQKCVAAAQRLCTEIAELTSALQHACSDSSSLPDTTALATLERESNKSFEIRALCAALLQVTLRLENRVHDLETREEELRGKVIGEREESSSSARGELYGATPKTWETDCETFEKLYRDEKKRRLAAEQRANDYRQKVEVHHQPKDEGTHQDLQTKLDVLHQRLKDQEAYTQAWKDERDTALDQLNAHITQTQESHQTHMQDLLTHTATYKLKITQLNRPEIAHLQARIQTLEREIETCNLAFMTVNNDKENLAKKQEKLETKIEEYEREIERLGDAVALGVYTPRSIYHPSDSDRASDSSSNASSHENASRPHRHVARIFHPAAAEARKHMMRSFRETQAKRRMEDKLESDLLEKIIAYKMQHRYPPRKMGWEVLRTQYRWDRWDGDEWFGREASEAEEMVIREMSGRRGWGISDKRLRQED